MDDVLPIELPLLYGLVWLGLLGLWVGACARAKEHCTRLHLVLGATAACAVIDSGVQLVLSYVNAYQPIADACHAAFIASFMLSIMLIAVGYSITASALTWSRTAYLLFFATIVGCLRYWRAVDTSMEVLVLALSAQVLVLVFILREASYNLHFVLMLLYLMRGERLPTDSILPKYYLFRHLRLVLSFVFVAYTVFGLWTITTEDDSSVAFLVLEQSLLLGTSVHLGLLLRPTAKWQTEEFASWNAHQLFDTYARVMQGLSVEDVLSEEEIIPMVGPGNMREVVVIQNPPSVADNGAVVQNIGVGVLALQ
ncbi:hypothetical protein ACHHYP_17299 [Achlya hypogyna]|uniref:Uncharacterized protein n=1 Tax=Achlya hypogyna TaxID=1202772 RepID=A0A1V9Y4P4_ACHHY|nr:hypothetical protein ACHHYP_17299 [Achlya hypogyna]